MSHPNGYSIGFPRKVERHQSLGKIDKKAHTPSPPLSGGGGMLRKPRLAFGGQGFALLEVRVLCHLRLPGSDSNPGL